MFAVLGNIRFQALGSPTQFDSKRGFKFAEHPVVEARPKLQWLSEELELLTLEMFFHVSIGNPAAQLAALVAAAKAHQAMPLVFGNGVHRGYFVITEIGETTRKRTATGAIIAIQVRVQLTEYARTVDPSAAPQTAAAAPAIVTPGSVNLVTAAIQQAAGTIVTNPDGTSTVNFSSANAGLSALLANPTPGGPATPNLSPDSVPASVITGAGV